MDKLCRRRTTTREGSNLGHQYVLDTNIRIIIYFEPQFPTSGFQDYVPTPQLLVNQVFFSVQCNLKIPTSLLIIELLPGHNYVEYERKSYQ